MASDRVAKPHKWFSNKGLRLSFPRRRSKSSCSSNSGSNLSSPSTSPPKNANNMSPREGDQLRQVFHYFDKNGDGKISALELRTYFGSIGEYMSHEAAQAVITDLDTDGDNLLNFEDFLRLMKGDHLAASAAAASSANEIEHDGEDDNGDHEEDLKMAFEMFEFEKGSGCITPKGLQRMLHRLGDAKSYEECVAMISVFDTDGNGVLDFHEFHQMMA